MGPTAGTDYMATVSVPLLPTTTRRVWHCDPGLVCIDLQPYGTTRAPDRADMLNIGGCSDAVFQVGAACLREDPSRFVAEK